MVRGIHTAIALKSEDWSLQATDVDFVCSGSERFPSQSKDSLAAKELLRHSSVSTTERHYIRDVPENAAQVMKLLESLCSEEQVQ